MTTIAVPRVKPRTLLRLGRVSNLPTVWTNVIAGAVIANPDASAGSVAAIALAMTALYVGGMYLNDYFDRDIDARERPGRPIAAGDVSATAVASSGFCMLLFGLGLLAPFGLPAISIGLGLAGSVVLYDVWHKGNAFGPVIMSACRALVYVATGAAVAGGVSASLAGWR